VVTGRWGLGDPVLQSSRISNVPFCGIAAVVIISPKTPGMITVTAEYEGLIPGIVNIISNEGGKE